MTVRYYSSVAAETTLTGSVNNSATTINIGSATGLPALTPFTMALDYEGATEELIEVTNVAGTSLTVTRGIDGTSATAHNAGARVRHVTSARDFTDSRSHENATAGVHGTTGSVVGTDSTQTLSNKTLNNATGTLNRIDILSEGGSGWQTTVNGDIDFNTNLMVWKRGPSEPNDVALIANNGNLRIRNQDPAADAVFNTYRLRITKNDGTTDIAYVTSGGEVKAYQDAGQNGITVQPRADNSTNRAFGVRDATNAVNRFAVYQDGRVDINGSNPAFSHLDIQAPAGQTADIMRVLNSGGGTIGAFQSDGRFLANLGGTFARPGITSGHVLQVGGANAGYTGNLTQWVNPSNVIVATVNQNGVASFAKEVFTSGATATSGWSVTGQVMRRTAGVTYVNITWTRTGGNINIGASGNISPDLQIGTVPASWRSAENIYTIASSGVGSGSARVNTDNTIDLLNWVPNTAIDTGENIRVTWTFIN